MEPVLVISPHPDDDAIGCGGTLRKHIVEGDSVAVIYLTSGEEGGHGKTREEIAAIREQEADKSASILQISKVYFWRGPDGHFRATKENRERLLQVINNCRPTLIYVPHENEEHPDHRAAANFVRQAVESLSSDSPKPVVWMYEVWTPIQQIDHIVDISPYIDIKRRAIQAHNSQCSVMKFDEAALGLSRYRGELHSWTGGDYAEVFSRMTI